MNIAAIYDKYKERRENAKWVKIPGTTRSYLFPFAPKRIDIDAIKNAYNIKAGIIREVR